MMIQSQDFLLLSYLAVCVFLMNLPNKKSEKTKAKTVSTE
jgi:hypothetical protein